MFQSLKLKVKKYLNNYIRDNFAVYYREVTSLETWFYYWLHYQNFSYAKDYTPKNVYYEFGTGWGGTLTDFLKASKRFSKDHNFDIRNIKIVLFDSFQGLPPVSIKEDDNPQWDKGGYAYSKDYITDIIKKYGFPLENVTFVEGYYENTLTPATFEKIKHMPPSIVTMDVDYYSSTKIAQDFISPLLSSGTVFYYDDLYSFFLHPDLGQVKAINEFNKEGVGYLNLLTDKNYAGRCYIFTKKEWEHFSKKDSYK